MPLKTSIQKRDGIENVQEVGLPVDQTHMDDMWMVVDGFLEGHTRVS